MAGNIVIRTAREAGAPDADASKNASTVDRSMSTHRPAPRASAGRHAIRPGQTGGER